LDAHLAKFFNLRPERARVDHHAITNNAGAFFVKDAGGNQVQDEFAPTYADGVARIVAALIASDDIKMWGQYVDDLAFAFVAPLGAHYYDVLHLANSRNPETGCGSQFRLEGYDTLNGSCAETD